MSVERASHSLIALAGDGSGTLRLDSVSDRLVVRLATPSGTTIHQIVSLPRLAYTCNNVTIEDAYLPADGTVLLLLPLATRGPLSYRVDVSGLPVRTA